MVKYLRKKIGIHYTAEFVNMVEDTPWCWFGIIWEWAAKQDWWTEFLSNNWRELINHRQQDRVIDMQIGIREELINPERFAEDIYNYLQKRENNGGVH